MYRKYPKTIEKINASIEVFFIKTKLVIIIRSDSVFYISKLLIINQLK
jgi:hypothetical protein